MGEVVNLRRARKAAGRADAAVAAAANRAKHGRSKGERAAEELAAAQRERTLDGARREP